MELRSISLPDHKAPTVPMGMDRDTKMEVPPVHLNPQMCEPCDSPQELLTRRSAVDPADPDWDAERSAADELFEFLQYAQDRERVIEEWGSLRVDSRKRQDEIAQIDVRIGEIKKPPEVSTQGRKERGELEYKKTQLLFRRKKAEQSSEQIIEWIRKFEQEAVALKVSPDELRGEDSPASKAGETPATESAAEDTLRRNAIPQIAIHYWSEIPHRCLPRLFDLKWRKIRKLVFARI